MGKRAALPASSSGLSARLLPFLLLACLLAGCEAGSANAPEPIDFSAHVLPVRIEPLSAPESLLDAPTLSEQARADLALRRAFFAHDFQPLDAALHAARERGLEQDDERHAAYRFIEGVRATKLAGLDACAAWLDAMPRSYLAHLACAAMWDAGAWEARGEGYAGSVTPARFQLMRERLVRANALLEKAVTLTPHPIEAWTMLGANHLTLGNHKAGYDYLKRAEDHAPTYSDAHDVRIRFALPEWHGNEKEVEAAIAYAAKLGVAPARLRDFRDAYVARPWKLSTPGAERAYWESALAREESFYRLDALARSFQRVENWRDGLPAAARLLKAYPDHADGYWMRGTAFERLGRIPEALADYRAAAALGHDLATQALIQAYVQGGLGLPARDWHALDVVCRYGAALGASTAANCLGSMYWEAASVGAPFRTDPGQSFAWHLLAARGGHFNSRHDLGWQLLTGRVSGMDAAQARQLGVFWLRRAADLDHRFAKQKLAEAGYAESETVGPETTLQQQVMQSVLPLLQVLF